MRLFGSVCLITLTALGPALAADTSFLHTAGAKQAAVLAAQCREVAQSSEYPCDQSNRCSAITRAIAQGCTDLNYGQSVIKPKFCRAYLGKR